MRLLGFIVLTSICLLLPVQAQQPRVVSSCGTPGITYTAGAFGPMTVDTTGTLCSSSGGGGGSNPAASATGSAVPADASYNGVNVGGTLRGQTGVNPSGSIYSAQVSGAGSAGSADPNVLTVQGIASMTALLVNPGTAANWGIQTQGSTTSGQSGVLVQGAVTTAAPTYTTAQTSPISLDTAGNLRVNVAAGSAGNAAASATGSAVPADGDYQGINVGGTLRGRTGVNPTGSVYAAQTDTSSVNGVSLGSPSSYGSSPGAVNVQGVNAFVTNTAAVNLSQVGGSAVALGSAIAASSIPVVIASNQSVADPCTFQAKTNVAIATSSGNVQLVAGVSGKRVYVCSGSIVGATAWVGNLIEGTGAACTTSAEAAVIGSTTAASGQSFAANGGMVFGGGFGTFTQTATAANGLCLLQSGTAALAGNITYVQQ